MLIALNIHLNYNMFRLIAINMHLSVRQHYQFAQVNSFKIYL